MKNFAIIPIKSQSTRVLNKNFRVLKDKPLWKWTLDKIIETNLFEKIYISTDKIELFDSFNYKNIVLHKRNMKLCKNHVHSIDVVFDVLKENKIDIS